MQIGKNTPIPKIIVNWPHKIKLGNNCTLENNCIFKFDGIWSKHPSIIIGDNVFLGASCEFNISGGIEIQKKTMIASGCKFIDHDHGLKMSSSMTIQRPVIEPIFIGEGVWLGVNVIVLKGVSIGAGTVVGAGSVVTKSIGENEVWAGVPAKFIRKRD